ncbi:DUF317 domain-containing protein [Streptomyces sp. H27-D2]|uniref:DUF317 domain-containing protein n=1 Tax=Streptomyces sp. H27-D2 TaxID=3046304 RepID=UPI002DBA3296|nr:DUF317 domain-containing protein [Streptomyces sp. H27-D2]MEC4018284.1 DUF317 domain-containing protein [Streptomyces sp. H27-D2]
MPSIAPYALEPGAEVLAGPVYLAGAGDSRVIAVPLDRAEGWTKTVAFGTDTYYTSPCQRVRIANALESHYGGWTIAFAEDPLGVPDWITTFDRNTPAEAIAAFTGTLVEGLETGSADCRRGGKQYTGDSPAALLAERGWEALPGARPHHRQVSPDGRAAYRIRSGRVHEFDELLDPEKSMWRMSAGLDPLNTSAWQAYFSSATPTHLIAASAAVLADPTPVTRQAHWIPERHRLLVNVQLPSTEQPASRPSAALARSSFAEKASATRQPSAAHTTAPVLSTASRRQR